MAAKNPTEFERAMSEGAGESFLSDLWHFLRHTNKWWMVPLIAILLGLSVLMLLSSSAVAPFIYTLF